MMLTAELGRNWSSEHHTRTVIRRTVGESAVQSL